MKKIEVISPVGNKSIDMKTVAPRLDTLEGKTVCETWNGTFKGDFMFPVFRELLKERYPGVKIVPYTEFPASPLAGIPEFQREVSKKIATMAGEKGCDALISGNGG